jgi:hypothetical protein
LNSRQNSPPAASAILVLPKRRARIPISVPQPPLTRQSPIRVPVT